MKQACHFVVFPRLSFIRVILYAPEFELPLSFSISDRELYKVSLMFEAIFADRDEVLFSQSLDRAVWTKESQVFFVSKYLAHTLFFYVHDAACIHDKPIVATKYRNRVLVQYG